MIDPVTMNARKPRDDSYGHAMLERMNEHHRELHGWALAHLSLEGAKRFLDIGFGGGQNIKNLRSMAPEGEFWGIDYSEASLKKCKELNEDGIRQGKVHLAQGSAEALPYEKDFFQLVTAFETVYYWPSIETCFRNVWEVLAPGGTFLICNEDSYLEGNEAIADALHMEFYSPEELEALLRQAGFSQVSTDRHENGKWICAVGRK